MIGAKINKNVSDFTNALSGGKATWAMPELILPHPSIPITTPEVVITRMSSGGYDPSAMNKSLILRNGGSLRTDTASSRNIASDGRITALLPAARLRHMSLLPSLPLSHICPVISTHLRVVTGG